MAFQFKGFKATRPVVRLTDPGRQEYEVFFTYYGPDKKKQVYRYKKGINSLKPRERKAQADAHADVLWEALHKGWNPLTDANSPFKEDYKRKQMNFTQALDYCLSVKKKDLSIASAYGYSSCCTLIKKAAIKSGYTDTNINLVERRDIRLILAMAKEMNNWTPGTRNHFMGVLKALMGVLIDEEIIKHNPVKEIKKEPAPKGRGYVRLTDDEQDRIYVHLLNEAPFYLEFLTFIYTAGIRPKEILLIKISDIDLKKRKIAIRPEVAKTNAFRLIPVTDDMLEILNSREVAKLPPDWYLFSKKKFAPGPKTYNRQTATNWWAYYIIKGLGINCKMYGLKHKGGDDKYRAGVSVKAIQGLFGHTSEKMTIKYLDAPTDILNAEVIAKSPSFSSKIVKMKRKEG